MSCSRGLTRENRIAWTRSGHRSLATALALLAAGLLAGGGCRRPPAQTPESVRRQAPSEWFQARRSGSSGVAQPGARSLAVAEARERGVTQAPGAWVNVGPTNVGGRVMALGVDPHDPARIWVGTAAGGVFLTEDEGATFRPVFDAHTALSIGSLVVHPTDSNTVYVGTGEDDGAGYVYDGEGVFKTTDGGENWVHLGLTATRRIGRMAIDPTNGDRVFAAAGGDWYRRDGHRGIYRSVDGGQSWQQVLYVGDDAGGIDVAIDPSDTRRVFAAIWQRGSDGNFWWAGGPRSGIYRSTDGGDTWARLTAGLPTSEMGKIGLAIAPTDPRVVYAKIMTPLGALQGLYRSTDRGDTWDKRNNNGAESWFGGLGWMLGGIRVDPDDPQTTYSLDIRLLRSANGGRSVGPAEGPVHADWHDLIVEPSRRWLAGTDGGLDISHDDGRTWVHAVGLPITQLYDLGIDSLDPRRRFAGSQDNGTLLTTTGSAEDWDEVLGNDGLQCEVDPSNPAKVYASMQVGDLYRSVDGGVTFVSAVAGIDLTENANWNAPVTVDPRSPSTIYTARTRVYRSIDSMISWSPISPVLTGSLTGLDPMDPPADGRSHSVGVVHRTVTVVAVSPVNRDVLWAGTDDGNVWVSDDGGAAWTKVNPPGVTYWVTDIAPDPRDASTAYLSVTGYRHGDRMAYVRVTDDLGATWTDITGNLPQVPVNTLVADTEWKGRVFAGGDVGVYVSDLGGTAWSDVRGGMPFVIVLDLVRHDPTRTLFAATHGRSIYTFDLAQLGPADGDGDGVDNNADCALADPGVFAPPGDVAGLSVERLGDGPATLRWSSLAALAGPDTAYDLARGEIADLVLAGGTASSGPLACGVTTTSHADPSVPPPSAGFYYLVRARNDCGIGGWGSGSGGTPRDSAACP